MDKERCEIILEGMVARLRVSDGSILAMDELLRDEEWLERDLEKCCKGDEVLERVLGKVRSLLHLNNLEYAKRLRDGRGDPMLPIVMKRLSSEFGYVERRDVTSGGREIQSIVLPMELVPMELRKLGGKDGE